MTGIDALQYSRRVAMGTGFELATRLALVTVLLAQAVGIIAAAPWSEGGVLLSLGWGHGVTVGDLPAAALVIAAGLVILLLPRRVRG